MRRRGVSRTRNVPVYPPVDGLVNSVCEFKALLCRDNLCLHTARNGQKCPHEQRVGDNRWVKTACQSNLPQRSARQLSLECLRGQVQRRRRRVEIFAENAADANLRVVWRRILWRRIVIGFTGAPNRCRYWSQAHISDCRSTSRLDPIARQAGTITWADWGGTSTMVTGSTGYWQAT